VTRRSGASDLGAAEVGAVVLVGAGE
jgi:hypothetical protein